MCSLCSCKRWLVCFSFPPILSSVCWSVYSLCVTLFYMKSIRVSTRDFHNFNYSSDIHVAFRHFFFCNFIDTFPEVRIDHISSVLRKRPRFSLQVCVCVCVFESFRFGGRMAPHSTGCTHHNGQSKLLQFGFGAIFCTQFEVCT